MKYIKINEKNAEKLKRMLKEANLLDNSSSARYNKGYVYFPVSASAVNLKESFKKINAAIGKGAKIVFMKGAKSEKRETYNDKLSKILTKDEMKELAKGYDLLGNIAIIELSENLKGKEKEIASALLSSSPNIKTVLKKAGPVHGVYRTRKLEYVAGEPSYIAHYRENGCIFEFDTRKVFFSNRLSYERSRIASQVRDKENVMVFFAGVGPFAIEIAKAHKSARIVAIELNRSAYMYMKKNIELNKTSNVTPVLGDVRVVSAQFKNFADRIVMPMPKTSISFMDEVLLVSKKHAIVHMYSFTNSSAPFDELHKVLYNYAKAHKCSISIIKERIVRPYSASEVEIVVDFAIDKH
ncbi:MAG: class I SAM-dependent methyltransferase [Candidatus Micrarchaeia archaeon]